MWWRKKTEGMTELDVRWKLYGDMMPVPEYGRSPAIDCFSGVMDYLEVKLAALNREQMIAASREQ